LNRERLTKIRLSMLIELEMYSNVAPMLREAALKVRANDLSITLVADLSQAAIFSLAIIEAALLDAQIPYQRRIAPSARIDNRPCISISEQEMSAPTPVTTSPLQVVIAPLQVDALSSSSGDVRRGQLSTSAQAAALAELIAPAGEKTRVMAPWSLAGNWLGDALEHTYDPVYTTLRDSMRDRGLIRVVPLPEVDSPSIAMMPGVDKVALIAIRDRWAHMDLEGRAQSLSHLVKPLLIEALPSTARLEELGWHRVVVSGWDVDLASQLHGFSESWRNEPEKRRRISADAIEALLKSGSL